MAAAAAAAGTEVAVKVVGDAAKEFAKAGTATTSEFITSFYGRKNGKAIKLEFPGVGLDTDGVFTSPELEALGINYLKTKTGGILYKYQIAISNSQSMQVTFMFLKCHVLTSSCRRLSDATSKPSP